ncbi:hypothetical protein TraAM80_02856 [Trypanosoma rangeli]|uniref:Uncharacterized protein n=1 Tax=Trypanosoma rangeli TaxID=5698 RepID=A0A422NSD5_TRYRA|nr:uncharacterized protein TraAM80_02856 [Trypanosoma rangeli]RNF08395.1 hypothetical protein TraAM80_02856 [Trypanosoma rangeli]|eukprot:RNF08395.1 hypothetical protein TraAM80_02856 [Trypanosoma rangeli]
MAKVSMSGRKGNEGAPMLFTPLNVTRTPPVPRRSLLERIHEESGDSTASEKSHSASASQRHADAHATSLPLSPGGVPNDFVEEPSGENVSRVSFANAATGAGSLDSFGGGGVRMIEEYGLALNDSFSAGASGGTLDAHKNTSSSAMLPRTNALYHLRDWNEAY